LPHLLKLTDVDFARAQNWTLLVGVEISLEYRKNFGQRTDLEATYRGVRTAKHIGLILTFRLIPIRLKYRTDDIFVGITFHFISHALFELCDKVGQPRIRRGPLRVEGFREKLDMILKKLHFNRAIVLVSPHKLKIASAGQKKTRLRRETGAGSKELNQARFRVSR